MSDDELLALIKHLRDLRSAATRGKWALTTYNGGFSFSGSKRAYCGTNEYYGEPQPVPHTEADHEFIIAAHNELPKLLNELERRLELEESLK